MLLSITINDGYPLKRATAAEQCSSRAVHLFPSTVCLITLSGINEYVWPCWQDVSMTYTICPFNTSWLSSSEVKRSSCWVIALNTCWYADVSPSLIKPSEQLISCRVCSVLCVLCVCVQRACNGSTDCSSAESFCAGWCKAGRGGGGLWQTLWQP